MVTGGAGFIGSNFVKYVRKRRPSWHITVIDSLTYAGVRENLAGLADEPRFTFVEGDITSARILRGAFSVKPVDRVVHLAAETHVDRSIRGPKRFFRTNLDGTLNMLQASVVADVRCFVHVSTDEVYGSLGLQGKFSESSPLSPNSPYSASKAAGDMLVQAFYRTYGFPAVVVRPSNTYGPHQYPEKLIPLFVTNIFLGQPVPLYGDGSNVRDWLFVEDLCRALLTVVEKAEPGSVYNVGGGQERTNLEITELVLTQAGGRPEDIEYVTDRPGHDRRYALDSGLISRELGFNPQTNLESGLKITVDWYRDNQEWWRPIRQGVFRRYYRRQYGRLDRIKGSGK
jgi:dTDP-glucose 4,6-dehydratase